MVFFLSSFTLDITAPLSHNLIIDEIVNEKFFKHGLKTSFYKVLDQDEKKVLLRNPVLLQKINIYSPLDVN